MPALSIIGSPRCAPKPIRSIAIAACWLVAPLRAESMDVGHILASGEIVGHAEIEGRLLGLAGLADGDLLATPRDERLAQAYRARAAKAAYTLRKSPVSARAGTARRD